MTCVWMAKEDILMAKYSSLVNYLKFQGCENLTRIDVGESTYYSCRTAGVGFTK